MGTISATRALVELKTLEGRIERAVNHIVATVPKRGNELPAGLGTQDEFTKAQKANLQAVEALIAHRRAVKSALVRSNAATTVTVAGEKMTVAEAIERKQSIKFEQMLLTRLANGLSQAVGHVEKNNEKVRENLLQLLEATYGKEGLTVTGSDYDAVAGPFLNQHEFSLVDPLNVKKRIEGLEKSIEDFNMEVDVALTESNARTELEV